MPVPSLTVTGINIVVVVLNVNSFQFNFELRWMMVAWPKAHPNDHHLETKCSHRLNLKMALVAKIHFLPLCTCLLEIGHDSWVRRKIKNAKVQTFLPFTGSAHLTFSHAPIMQFFLKGRLVPVPHQDGQGTTKKYNHFIQKLHEAWKQWAITD